MAIPHPNIPDDLLFYISAEHECSYLPDRNATTLFADPEHTMSPETFSTLSEMGFRRSGCLVYTPRCKECSACIPIRVNTHSFSKNRSQRRNWRHNEDIEVSLIEGQFSDEHISLYQRYIRSRHPDGSMDVESKEQVEQFFLCQWSDTQLAEFRLDGQLLALAVVDRLASGLSAVYTFFDPNESQRGLGVYAVLWLIEEAKKENLPFVYLGYLIKENTKMAYKAGYKPQECFIEGRWKTSEGF